MKAKRRALIMELTAKHEIETQEELTALLTENGCGASQATISRDIRDLGLTKRRAKDGRYVYAPAAVKTPAILHNGLISMELCGNILVIKTRPGMAMAAAAELDTMDLGLAGTIAGDDTIFCAVKNESAGRAALSRIKKGMVKE